MIDSPRSATVKTGVLLVNLGTPNSPSTKDVRKFLAEFLSDRRVIDYPRLLWLPILYGVILQVRPPKTAHAYAQIWTSEGSPLLVQSRALEKSLGLSLGTTVPIALGMTYGSPSIATALRSLRDQGVTRVVAIPLYPQFSFTTTAPVRDRVDAELKTWKSPAELCFIDHYYSEPRYLDALASSIREHWKMHERKHLLFSFHGIPQRYVDNGDPYFEHCVATARGAVDRLGLASGEWSLAFQSRVTKEKWLEPYTDKVLLQYAKSGPKDVAVLCPAFATDCLETLEEIALRNREMFLQAGGKSFEYIPCLNNSPAHIDMFASLVNRARSSSGQLPAAGGQ